MVAMMSRTLISRPNVEKVVKMADMDIGLESREDRERLINRVAKELEIKSAGRDNLYTISYHDQDPQQAKRVVQSLLKLFVEESLATNARTPSLRGVLSTNSSRAIAKDSWLPKARSRSSSASTWGFRLGSGNLLYAAGRGQDSTESGIARA